MICANCGRAIHFDKKKRALHTEPIQYGKVMSVLFCYPERLIVAKEN